MKNYQLIIHIGYPKTASTFLQKKIFNNKNFNFLNISDKQNLLELFILASNYESEKFKRKTKKNKINLKKNMMNIISYEFLSINQFNHNDSSINTLKNFNDYFEGKYNKQIEIEFLIINRNSNDLLFSLYHEDISLFLIKSINNKNYQSFIKKISENKNKQLFYNFNINEYKKDFEKNNLILNELSFEELRDNSDIFFLKLKKILKSNNIKIDNEIFNKSIKDQQFVYHKKSILIISFLRIIFWSITSLKIFAIKPFFIYLRKSIFLLYSLTVVIFFPKNHKKHKLLPIKF